MPAIVLVKHGVFPPAEASDEMRRVDRATRPLFGWLLPAAIEEAARVVTVDGMKSDDGDDDGHESIVGDDSPGRVGLL